MHGETTVLTGKDTLQEVAALFGECEVICELAGTELQGLTARNPVLPHMCVCIKHDIIPRILLWRQHAMISARAACRLS